MVGSSTEEKSSMFRFNLRTVFVLFDGIALQTVILFLNSFYLVVSRRSPFRNDVMRIISSWLPLQLISLWMMHLLKSSISRASLQKRDKLFPQSAYFSMVSHFYQSGPPPLLLMSAFSIGRPQQIDTRDRDIAGVGKKKIKVFFDLKWNKIIEKHYSLKLSSTVFFLELMSTLIVRNVFWWASLALMSFQVLSHYSNLEWKIN